MGKDADKVNDKGKCQNIARNEVDAADIFHGIPGTNHKGWFWFTKDSRKAWITDIEAGPEKGCNTKHHSPVPNSFPNGEDYIGFFIGVN